MTVRVIFNQWPKLHLGLDALSNQKILKFIYVLLIHTDVQSIVGVIIGSIHHSLVDSIQSVPKKSK